MKTHFLTLMILVGILASNASIAQDTNYGAKIDASGAMAMGDLVKQLQGKEKMDAKVEATVSSVCQAKGCWMILDGGQSGTMRVTFKDYEFFVPKDIAGKTVIIQGTAQMNTTTVAELRHFAEDAKKSKEEIEKITEPKTELVFEAEGVIVKQ